MTAQLIGRLINDIIILALFIYMALLVSGKIKLKPEKQEKFNNLIQRRGTLLNIISYSGIIFSVYKIVKTFAS